ncbi:MAG: purine-nucleoside phosphorylase [Myxococcota bacterium]|nr:purine-nucleoside phosphorylase [Myxococcota bacterium]
MSEQGTYELVSQIAASIRARCARVPKVALVLGSGLGAFVDELDDKSIIPYSEIPGFPVSSVHGHAGNLVFGRIAGLDVVAMQGRIHFYECGELQRVVLPVRVLKALGAEIFIATNAAGGVNRNFAPGELMLIRDHLNMMMAASPLIGPNDERFGPRFPDMSEPYAKTLCDAIERAAERLGQPLQQGVYCAFHGPEYETPAEVRMAALLGADAVGMSTVPEVIAANHMGMRCAGISCITNLASGIGDEKLSHEDVMATGKRAAASFCRLLSASLEEIAKQLDTTER